VLLHPHSRPSGSSCDNSRAAARPKLREFQVFPYNPVRQVPETGTKVGPIGRRVWAADTPLNRRVCDQIQPRDTVTYLFATLFLLTVLLAGAAIPAIRAARLDPIRALRYE
jgi:hypothetical protein